MTIPKGPQQPTVSSCSASTSGPSTSPVASTDPSSAMITSPVDRRRPAFRAAAHPVPDSSDTTSTSSPHRPARSPVTSATTYWTERPPAFARNESDARWMSSGHPSQTQCRETSVVGGSSSTEATSPARTGSIGPVGTVASSGSSVQPPGVSATVHPASAIRSRRRSAVAKSFAARAAARSSASRTTSGDGSAIDAAYVVAAFVAFRSRAAIVSRVCTAIDACSARSPR